jgi:hypothetical protein
MRSLAIALLALLAPAAVPGQAASLPSCDAGVAKYSPCELRFEWSEGELPSGKSPFRDELLNVAFRGPDATTYLIRAFWDGGRTLRVRFTPNQAGTWTYRITSVLKRFDNRQSTFAVADDSAPGFVAVANVRHWRTDNKQPHLWMSAEAPWVDLDDAAFRKWADARKSDGFTHIRGVLLTENSHTGKPLSANSEPDVAYFSALDDRLLYANGLGLTLDLILADGSFLKTGAMDTPQQREPLVRYLVARYGALNVCWQGIERFEDQPHARPLLDDIGSLLGKYDSFQHPRSTDARQTSSMLLRDSWENYIVEASANPQLGDVERQITAAPQIHVIQGVEPDAFRHELWVTTTNGEYPTMRFEASQNPANIQAMRLWFKIMSNVRHWEFEPFFDVDGARCAGLDNVEYLLYAQQPGIVEITFPEKHKYDAHWINPVSGETIELKDVKQDAFSEQTPGGKGGWLLQLERTGKKASMLKSYRFESVSAPIQEIELDPAKVPFQIVEPAGQEMEAGKPATYEIKITRANRATRSMEYLWTGEIVAEGEGPRVLALGASGSFEFPAQLMKTRSALLNVTVSAVNAVGKAYSISKVYQISR